MFGSATNATFANVTFEDVAISNVADSAAVLLGVHAGNSGFYRVRITDVDPEGGGRPRTDFHHCICG